MDDGFGYIANFFEGSLRALQARNLIETAFRRLDANRFTAVAYRDGEALKRSRWAACSAWAIVRLRRQEPTTAASTKA
ncbi:hypothetical protein [Afipia sp. GAS231]|uniref:hypothetical protein n=1 Tax=Afipia sp. GAS231 TaxID=1882747 RepID=UPI0012F7AEBD|nr:hypothetical protein [Afipia sp. GAS231]